MKLRHRSLVNNLFEKGRSEYAYPLRVIWYPMTHVELDEVFKYGVPLGIGRLQFMLTVPKRKHRHAVDRVLLRRRMREAFRLLRPTVQKWLEEHPEVRTLQVAVVYISPVKEPMERVMDKMGHIFFKMFSTLT